MTNSTIFHWSPFPATGASWCNQIISTLNFSFFGTYTFPSFKTKSSSICHFSPHNIFTSAFFISSTTLTTSSSLFLVFFIFSTISTLGSSITTSYILWIQLTLINTWSLLSFSTPIFQSGHLYCGNYLSQWQMIAQVSKFQSGYIVGSL